jgi:hypothetical protein
MVNKGVFMNELINFIKDKFSAFVELMIFIPSELQISSTGVSELAVLVFILVVALAAIFLSARWMKKYNPGLAGSVLLAFLILSLTLGLTGFLLSIPQLSVSASDTFLVLCIGSPVFNLILGVMAALGNRLRNNRPIAGALLLCATGFLFAYVLFTTFILFALRLYN